MAVLHWIPLRVSEVSISHYPEREGARKYNLYLILLSSLHLAYRILF